MFQQHKKLPISVLLVQMKTENIELKKKNEMQTKEITFSAKTQHKHWDLNDFAEKCSSSWN